MQFEIEFPSATCSGAASYHFSPSISRSRPSPIMMLFPEISLKKEFSIRQFFEPVPNQTPDPPIFSKVQLLKLQFSAQTALIADGTTVQPLVEVCPSK